MNDEILSLCSSWVPKFPVDLAKRWLEAHRSDSVQIPSRVLRLTVPWHPRLIVVIRQVLRKVWGDFKHVLPPSFQNLVLDVAVQNAGQHWLHVLRANNFASRS